MVDARHLMGQPLLIGMVLDLPRKVLLQNVRLEREERLYVSNTLLPANL